MEELLASFDFPEEFYIVRLLDSEGYGRTNYWGLPAILCFQLKDDAENFARRMNRGNEILVVSLDFARDLALSSHVYRYLVLYQPETPEEEYPAIYVPVSKTG
ncbi:MAG: hypothetical protein HZB70_01205 [Candidatus Berkelbacteria bacterium]|nr:MAG: hypothetical protein HZB70_01205 [Candidatus Berkelbacteria bacterium]QQG52043.1 MAG: hypothetical protein HY845_01790 [Candidatus Berkelbacteria bacterium]